jgi:cytidylate kinase
MNCLYLDTGAMYRAVALAAKRRGIDPDDEKGLGQLCGMLDLHFDTTEDPPHLFVGGEDVHAAIRSPEMDMLASQVSAQKRVRDAMVTLQRRMAKGINLVAEGRDMGTVVFPHAEHKYFLRASIEVRAERRYREQKERGEDVSLDNVRMELKRRDHQDETRSLAPLRPAKDAKIVDSTDLSPGQVLEVVLRHLEGGIREIRNFNK